LDEYTKTTMLNKKMNKQQLLKKYDELKRELLSEQFEETFSETTLGIYSDYDDSNFEYAEKELDNFVRKLIENQK
jgi:hypothetical protein